MSEERPTNQTEAVLEHHLTAFGEQDLDAILADYTDESVVVTNMGTFRGLDEITGLFENFFEEFGKGESSIEVEQTEIEGEFAYIVWHGESVENVYEFCTDTFYIHGSAIRYQSFAGKLSPKN